MLYAFYAFHAFYALGFSMRSVRSLRGGLTIICLSSYAHHHMLIIMCFHHMHLIMSFLIEHGPAGRLFEPLTNRYMDVWPGFESGRAVAGVFSGSGP
jgi:hypothetical protein